jgi:hypothetical protein
MLLALELQLLRITPFADEVILGLAARSQDGYQNEAYG